MHVLDNQGVLFHGAKNILDANYMSFCSCLPRLDVHGYESSTRCLPTLTNNRPCYYNIGLFEE